MGIIPQSVEDRYTRRMETAHDSASPLLHSVGNLSVSDATLNFCHEFDCNRTPEEFVITVNQHIHQLHAAKKIGKFRIFFSAFDMFVPDIEHWVAFAVSKGVEELHLDLSLGYVPFDGFSNGASSFKLPQCLFDSETLTHLTLNCCVFSPPSGFTGFRRLQSLSLKYAHVEEDAIQSMLVNCTNLECLSLDGCFSLERIIISAPDIRLKSLAIVDCMGAYEIVISATKLQSFIYCGECCFEDVNVPLLSDAFISSVGVESCEPEHDYIKLLSALKHVRILTVCTATLMRVEIYESMDLPDPLLNLQELQILMDFMDAEYLSSIYAFFRLCPCPCLERLFFQLPRTPGHRVWSTAPETVVEEPLTVVFNHLKAIKMRNFRGSKSEMRLVRFLLEKAVVLETLVLVMPEKSDLKETPVSMENCSAAEETDEDMMDVRMLHQQLVSLQKASPIAKITVCEVFDDDRALNPMHTEYYCNSF